MIYTTYFAQLRNLPSHIIPISICGKAPIWYTGLQYKKLAPKYDFFMEWKENHDNDYYIKCFNEQVLSPLNADEVVKELKKMLSDVITSTNYTLCQMPHIALVCYEKPTDFCHRHLVAQWFNDNGIECKEWIKGEQNESVEAF